jgi:hypothetical protein
MGRVFPQINGDGMKKSRKILGILAQWPERLQRVQGVGLKLLIRFVIWFSLKRQSYLQ